jgi:hypothetical protein
MAKQLTDLVIDEISLVDDPANEEAKVSIFKAKKKVPCDKTSDMEDEDDMDDEKKVKKQMDAISSRIPAALEELSQLIVEKAALAGGVPVDSVAALTAAASLKEYTMDIQALSKALEDAEVKLATLEKRATEADAVIKAKDEEITVLKGKAEAASTEEEIIKSASEPVQKMLNDLRDRALISEAAIAKMKEEKEVAEAIAKAKDLNFGEAETVGKLLMRVAKGTTTADDASLLEGMLKQAGEVTKGSKLFVAVGASNGDVDPEAIIKSKAAEIRKGNPLLSEAQAYTEALDQNPDLYNAYSAAKRRAA